ncbi:type II CRISPR RNA-guided endonuclease Cas9 [Ottowia sp.]|uniref:type II CRISPR RNA-guided endonuclease Cas9 n=1 Tax=Ottowia sp. TaxID=1898956 RepID=UPI0032E3D650
MNSALEPNAIIRAGVRIFSDGRNPKDGSSLAVTRRAARAMRRRRDRLLRRKARMVNKLVEYGFFPADPAERKALELQNPYELRAKGLHEALTPREFGRAVFHLNQRRGFKSNRKTDKGESDAGALKSAIVHLREDIQAQGLQTVGELLWQRMQAGKGTRARYREARVPKDDGKTRIEKSYDLYIDRQMIADEFDALWRKQASLNPTHYTDAARDDLRDTLLYQRKLRPVTPGRCTLLPELARAPLALPSTQRFRILQEVNHLRLLDERLQERPLTEEQRDRIVAALEQAHKVTFKGIRKLLKLGGVVQFNLEDEKRPELKGNATSATLSRDEHFGARWFELDTALQDDIVLQLLNEESEDKLVDWLAQHTGVDDARARKIANAGLPEGYGSLSREALARILPALRACEVVDGVARPRTYDKAVLAAGFAHHSVLAVEAEPHEYDLREVVDSATGEIKQQQVFKALPYYGKALQRHVAFGSGNPEDTEEKRFGKIANPTVHIGLNQVRLVVNALIRRYGHPTEVVVELARDLKQSREQKQETQKKQAENQRRNERIRREIATIRGIEPFNVKIADIQKWILWEELSFDVADRRCPYSGVQISASMVLKDEVEIEHILPFSQTLDDSLNNRTVAMRSANRVKGNRTPWDAREDFEHQDWSYDGILLRAERMPKGKRYRFAADGYEQWLRDDKGFLARALNDTRYLSRIAKEYLTLICPGSGVRVIPGQMTAMLRRRFGLNDVLGMDGEKNRDDHRHHAVDACVIGVTDQGLLQRFAQASADARNKGLDRLVEQMPLPWPTYRDHVARAVRHIWVSHRPDHGHEGAMHNDTAYGLLGAGKVTVHKRIEGKRERTEENLKVIAFANEKAPHGTNRPWFGSAHHKPAKPYKGYKGDSNYCIEIVRNEKGKWEGEVISTFEAYQLERKLRAAYRNQHGKSERAPSFLELLGNTESISKKPLVMRLMRDDMVRLVHGGVLMTLRIATIKTNGQILFAPHQESNVDARNRDKDDPFSYVSKTPGSLFASQGRRVTVSPIGDLRDPGWKSAE